MCDCDKPMKPGKGSKPIPGKTVKPMKVKPFPMPKKAAPRGKPKGR